MTFPGAAPAILLAILFLVPGPDPACPAKAPAPVVDPALNPLSPEAGSFLETDLYALRRTAEAAYQAGDMKGAAAAYLALLQRDIGDADSIYNLACCYGRMGDAEKAARFLIRAFYAGYEDHAHMKRDRDFDAVRGKLPFDFAVDAVGARLKDREAQGGESVLLTVPSPVACRVRIPEGLTDLHPPTLLVALHGSANRPEDLTPLWDAIENPAFILAAPPGPFARPDKTRVRFSWQAPLRDDSRLERLHALAVTERYLVGVIRELTQRYGAREVYLMGFSQGAEFAYAVGLRHPELLTGVLSFGGRFPEDLLDARVLEEGKGLRVFAAHGSRDHAVSVLEMEEAEKILKKRGYEIFTLPFDGEHEIPDAVFRRAVEWMSAPRGDASTGRAGEIGSAGPQ